MGGKPIKRGNVIEFNLEDQLFRVLVEVELSSYLLSSPHTVGVVGPWGNVTLVYIFMVHAFRVYVSHI